MIKVAFYVNMPSPYRVDFFNELGKFCDLYVLFEMNKSATRNDSWQSYNFENFHGIFLKGKVYSGESAYCPKIIKEYKKIKPDINFVCNYSSLSGIKLLNYFIRKRINYIIEGDGAFNKKDNFIKHLLKKRFITHATSLFYTSDEHKKYLISHGANEKQLILYPFSSIFKREIISEVTTEKEKNALKKELGIKNMTTTISVGRFLSLKNFELLIEAHKKYDSLEQLLIIGDKPTQNYLELISKLKIKNVHFIPFMNKDRLLKYYLASDLFVFTSLCDVWGLVINEAMSQGMPIICSDGALGGVELSKNNFGIRIYPKGNLTELEKEIGQFLNISREDKIRLGKSNLTKIKEYTIETMCNAHVAYLENQE